MRRRLTPDASICGDVLIPSYRQTPDLSTVKRSRPEVRSPTMGSSPYLEPSNVGRPAPQTSAHDWRNGTGASVA